MASALMMNAQAFPFFPSSSSSTTSSNLSSPSQHQQQQQQQQQHQAACMSLSASDAALDLSKLSLPEGGAEQGSSSSSLPHRLPGYGYRVTSPMHYPTAPFPLAHSSSSSSSGSPYGAFASGQRQSPYAGGGGGGADEYVAELPVTPPLFLSHKRSQSQTAGLQPPLLLQQPPHRGHHISGDSYTSTASATSSPASSFPHSSPQSSPPYSPRDDLSPPQAASRYTHSQHSHPVNTDHTRRLSDAALGFSSTVIAYHTAPTPLSSASSSFTSSSGSSSPSSSSTSTAPVSSGVVDPRAYEPERLHALICVVLHMESAGSQQKFLSQLGILYKQMFPQLFVKGMLKDLVDHAVSSGLLKLTGPAGQQQVFLTAQARMAGGQMLSSGSGSQLQASLQQHYGSAGLQQSQSPAPSPSGTPPPQQAAAAEDDDSNAQQHQRQARPRSGSNAGMGSSRHSRSSTVQYGNSGRLTPNTSPQLAGNNAVMPLPPLSIAASVNSASLSLTSPALSSSSAAFYPSFSTQSSFPSSAAPFSPSSLEEKYFRHEKVRHLRYMFHFRVHACKAFLSKQCPAMEAGKKGSSSSSSTDCFDYHSSSKMRRRVPRIVQYSNGTFWSYNACRCQAVEKEIRCEKGDSCRYSHNKEEIAYHPSRYKTQPCSYPARPDGVCTRFGLHCAYAHGDDDIRRPIVLRQGMPHKLLTDDSNNIHIAATAALQQQQAVAAAAAAAFGSMSVSSPHNGGMQSGDQQPLYASRRGSITAEDADYYVHADLPFDAPVQSSSSSSSPSSAGSAAAGGLASTLYLNPDEFMSPKDCLLSDRLFYLYAYKVRACTEPSAACLQGCCPHYHYDNKRRRNPRIFKYAHEACPNVRPEGAGQWRRPACCPLGDACLLAHTLLEAMYHPEVYKTVMCSNFDEKDPQSWRRCQWGRMCAHAHSRAELEFNELCVKHGEPQPDAAAAAALNGLALFESEAGDAHGMLSAPSGLYYRDGKPKDTKPPLPPGARSAFSHSSSASSSSSSPSHSHGSQTSYPQAQAQAQSMSALWAKPNASTASTSSSAFSYSSLPSASSSPSSSSPTASSRAPNPIQPRTLTPLSSTEPSASSFFTPLGPTVLREDGDAAQQVDDEDSIIVKPSHHFASASSASSPSSASFLSSLTSSAIHSWQSSPPGSGAATPSSSSSSALQHGFLYDKEDAYDDRFDASFLDSSSSSLPSAASSASRSSRGVTSPLHAPQAMSGLLPSASAELQQLRQQLKEEASRASELRRDNVLLRKRVTLLADEKLALTNELSAVKDRLHELERGSRAAAAAAAAAATAGEQPGAPTELIASARSRWQSSVIAEDRPEPDRRRLAERADREVRPDKESDRHRLDDSSESASRAPASQQQQQAQTASAASAQSPRSSPAGDRPMLSSRD